ncbi:hypothetical protein [Carboxylicivirga caseinilyticus]|uniref:hypothetical protein n=1 Tax=Carboxylicivirga caseinilyticus TaxID=3417572 RepID=UPI003D325CED|nr:hypothetical protein [Marinilabiliaceae bacterium A049]
MAKTLTLLTVLLISLVMNAQTSSFEGTFMNNSNNISLQFKKMDKDYHGMLSTAGTNFAMKAQLNNNQLVGTIYGMNGPFDFTATLQGTNLTLNSAGSNESFYKLADVHYIANLDLTPYMVDFSQKYANNQNQYSGSEQLQQNNQTATNNNTQYQTQNNQNQELLNLISGSQLVYYQRTSYVSDNLASSITYVNFCPNGRFSINYDGSFSVSGNYGGYAGGASSSHETGTWKLITYEGQPAVFLQYDNGETSTNVYNINYLKAGRWRIGNTQYALVRNKVRCN